MESQDYRPVENPLPLSVLAGERAAGPH